VVVTANSDEDDGDDAYLGVDEDDDDDLTMERF